MTGLQSPSRSPKPQLTVAISSFGLLVAEAASVGLCGWTLRAASRLPGFIATNSLTPLGRKYLLANMIVAVAIAVAGAGAYLAIRGRQGLFALNRVAVKLSPLILVALVPLLLNWKLWTQRDLSFLVIASAFGLTLRAFLHWSLSTGPLLRVRWTQRLRERCLVVQRTSPRFWRAAPLVLVCLSVAGYAAFFSYHTVANHRNLLTASLDLGLENNLLWNLVHGGPFLKSSPAFGPVGSHFGYHATFFAYVIAPFYVLAQRPETLLIFQSVMIGAAAIPLFLFAKRHVGAWVACLVALFYILYPPVHGSNLYDFHYLPLGPFFLWSTLYLVEARRDWLAALALVLTLSIREDVAAGLVIVGAYLLFAGERPKAGALVALCGAVYFFALKMVIMPLALRGDSSFVHQYQGLLPQGERGFGGILKTVIGNPAFTLVTLLERDKLMYALQIMAPLCFFPWLRPIGLLCSLPGFFFTLLATGYPPLIQISFQYTAHWTSFVFIALVANLRWIKQPRSLGDGDGTVRQRSWLMAIAATSIIVSHQYGALLQQNTVRGGFSPYKFHTTDADRARLADLHALIAMVPPRAKIVSAENIVPHVSSRPDAYTLRMSVFDAEYLLFAIPLGGYELSNAAGALRSNDFGVVSTKGAFVLARRGHPVAANAEVLARLGQ